MSTTENTIGAEETARLRALTRDGADRAVAALADLTGRPCKLRGPTTRMLPAERLDAPFVTAIRDEEEPGIAGVFFDIEGGLEGVLAILLPEETVGVLLEQLVGMGPKAASAEIAESALREVGNILASHFVSALGDALNLSVLPSVPVFVPGDAPSELGTLLGSRADGRPVMRIECEVGDATSEVRGLIVFVPDTRADG